MISVLCANRNSNYKLIPGIDVWDQDRDAYFFTGSNPVITHAPCAQWSHLKAFARPDADQKELAYHCLKYVVRNGGIFEHPAGSSFFKAAGVTSNIYSVDQLWWGFPARKTTYLFFSKCRPLAFPVMCGLPTKVVAPSRGKDETGRHLPKSMRSTTVLPFAHWMINCINEHIKH